MNQAHLRTLCKIFSLNTAHQAPQSVQGGLLHLMWRIDTNKATYAIKQLSASIRLTESVIQNYELSEQIASRFIEQGISGIHAIQSADKYLHIIEGTGYLVYPWINAATVEQHKISEQQALEIAVLLAKLHQLDLSIPEISASNFDIHTNDTINALADKSAALNCPFASHLKEKLYLLQRSNNAYQQAIPFLEKQLVISHGDLDPKNVLWDKKGKAILIDWESARKLNPGYEIVNASLDWSGITNTHFNKALFTKMIDAYKDAGGMIEPASVERSLAGVLGNWLNWLVYNIERACTDTDSENKIIGITQVNQTLITITKLQTLIPELSKIFK